MQILLIILIAIIGILTLSGLFFFYEGFITLLSKIRRWATRNKKKVIGVTVGGMVFGAGIYAMNIIPITKALHLDSDRNIISDIYDQVKAQDDIWSEKINHGEYIRVTFEQELESHNDITIYVRNREQIDTIVQVFLKDSDELITSFPRITYTGYYKIYLTNMTGKHAVFDLRVWHLDGLYKPWLEFDYIVDPDTGWKNPSAEGDTYSEWTLPTNAYASNNNHAQSKIDAGENEQDYYNFNFGVPAGATIDGVIVSMEANRFQSISDVVWEIKLTWDAGNTYTNGKANTWSEVADTIKEYGAFDDTWGRAWSSTDFADANFRVYVKQIGGGLFSSTKIDHIKVKVYYTAASANLPPSQSNPNPTNRSFFGLYEYDVEPLMSITVDDPEDDTLTATWWSNSSGSWVQFDSNNSINTGSGAVTIRQYNANFSTPSTEYWWSVNLTDIPNGGNYTNVTYNLITRDSFGFFYLRNLDEAANQDLGNLTRNQTTSNYNDDTRCGAFIWFIFHDNNYWEVGNITGDINVTHIYYHISQNVTGAGQAAGENRWGYHNSSGDNDEYVSSYKSDAVSNRSIGGIDVSTIISNLYPVLDNSYIHSGSLFGLWNITSGKGAQLGMVSSLRNTSFIWINPPNNTTLKGDDSDSDSLTDYEELYITWTDPFDSDTDNDGVTDYYENLSGSDPNNYTDTIAWNVAPTITGEIPANQSTSISLTPQLNVTVDDSDDDYLNITWLSNSSGSWVQFASNSSLVGGSLPTNIIQTNSNFSAYNTKYWWSINVSDGTTWTNETYHFTTLQDTTPPSITINFAGNLSDSGGPYYRPPGESTMLTGVWSDGYYTNESRQHEYWIYINLTVIDAESSVTNVWLNWNNETTWTNWSYGFNNPVGNYWEYNTSGNIQTCEGYDYSFNIVANSSGGSKVVYWNKTGLGGNYARRHVQLNCTPENISYSAFYVYTDITGVGVDNPSKDRKHHDQGQGNSNQDSAMLRTTINTDALQNPYCSDWVQLWFDNSTCVQDITLDNIYYHVWYSVKSATDQADHVGWGKTRDSGTNTYIDDYTALNSDSRANLYIGSGVGGSWSKNYNLTTHLLDVTNTDFTDNSIFELGVRLVTVGTDAPAIASNRSYTTFILFNVPDNVTLNSSHADTDSDGLSDWTELYVNHTNPFLNDTDGDGVTDYYETLSGSNPNDYTDTTEYVPRYNTTVRTNGEDYFTWAGTNTTAYYVGLNITGFNEGTEYIAILNNSGNWWKYYYGDGAGGTNWSICTYDVVKIVMDDAVGNTTFDMYVNPDITYDVARTVTLNHVGDGHNYTGFSRNTSTTLSAINNTIGFSFWYFVALWNETNFEWDYWIAYWPYNVDKNVHKWDVCITKISTNRTWNQ